MADFSARHVAHTGTLSLTLPILQAFPLFTAEGERQWVPGWEPTYLHPAHPSNEVGTLFRTNHGGDETIWLVLQYDPAVASVEYARVAPATRAGTVTVRCEALGEQLTQVHVSYALTALSPAGNAMLEALTPTAYSAMLDDWRTLIHKALGIS